MDTLKKFSDRGYVVTETGPVYYTMDMDQTVAWFEDVLGWYAEIDERNADGKGMYGCVYSLPKEIEVLHIAPFTGIHLFFGEPKTRAIALMQVRGIDALHAFVKARGWTQITEVQKQPWGAKMCQITTADGCVLQFFELA